MNPKIKKYNNLCSGLYLLRVYKGRMSEKASAFISIPPKCNGKFLDNHGEVIDNCIINNYAVLNSLKRQL